MYITREGGTNVSEEWRLRVNSYLNLMALVLLGPHIISESERDSVNAEWDELPDYCVNSEKNVYQYLLAMTIF